MSAWASLPGRGRDVHQRRRKLPAISPPSSSPPSGAPQPRREGEAPRLGSGSPDTVPHNAPPARLADHRARRRRGPPRGQDFCRTIKADDDSSVASDNTEPSLMSPGLGRRQLEAASMHSDYGDDASSRDGGSESTEEENCAVRIARSNELAQAEHKRIVRQSWREFEERVVATFGAEHDRMTLPTARRCATPRSCRHRAGTAERVRAREDRQEGRAAPQGTGPRSRARNSAPARGAQPGGRDAPAWPRSPKDRFDSRRGLQPGSGPWRSMLGVPRSPLALSAETCTGSTTGALLPSKPTRRVMRCAAHQGNPSRSPPPLPFPDGAPVSVSCRAPIA